MWIRFCWKRNCFVVWLFFFSNRDWRRGISGPSEDETTENPNDQEDNENEDVDNGTDVGDEGGSSDQDDEEIEANLWTTDYTFTVVAQYKTGSGSATTASTSTNENVFHIQWQTESGSSVDWGNTGTAKNSSASVDNGAGTVDGSYFSYNFYNLFQYKRRARISGINGYKVCGISTSSSFTNTSYTSSYSYVYFYGSSSSSSVQTSTSAPSSSSVGSQISSCTIYIKLRKEYTCEFYDMLKVNVAQSKKMLAGVAFSTTSPSVGTSSSQVGQWRNGYYICGFSETQGLENGNYVWAPGASVSLSASQVNRDYGYYTVLDKITYYISYSLAGGSSGTYAPTSARWEDAVRISNPTRTGYTFAGWTAATTDTYNDKLSSSACYGSSSSNISTSWDGTSKITVQYFKNLLESNYLHEKQTVTFTANWTINTYTLTIRYYGGTSRQTNTTNLSIGASSCTVSSSSIASGGSATVKHTYSTSSYSVVLKLSNSATYDYYLRTGSNPTTSTYTKLYTTSSDSYTYTWKPDSNDTLSIYVKQRYTITYNKNGGTGTLPSTTYKIHGTSVTLGTNNLTKTSYTANGWNTNTTGTGTHYNSGGSYSTNANDTLYADWTPKTSTIKVQIKTSTNGSSYSNSATGGTVSVRYYYDNNNTPATKTASVTSASLTTVATNALVSQTVTFTPTAKSGYVFVGISTSTSAPNSTATTFTPSSSGATYTINVFFKVLSSNQLKYDSTEKYWYFEHGEYPQSYVGTSMNNTLNSASPTKSGEIKYNDGTTNQKIEVYTYNSKRYARLQATSTQTLKMSDGTSYTFTKNNWYWFEVEPIRWRVSDYGVSSTTYPTGWSTYGTYKTNFTVVSDRILTIGAVETNDVNEGWAFKDSDIYSNISGLNKTASTTNFSASITNKQGSTNYTYYKFGSAGQQDKVVSVSVTEDGVRVASIEEIKTYLNDYSAKASDMVCFLLGCGTDDEVNYWTRNLGTGLGNGQIVTKAGVTKSTWFDNVQGVRFALTMGNGSRI